MGIKNLICLIASMIFLTFYFVNALEFEEQPIGPVKDEDDSRNKRQAGRNPLNKAWEEALPGVQPFWEKYR